MPRPSRRVGLSFRGALWGALLCAVALVGWAAAGPEVEPAELLVELQAGSEPRGEPMGEWFPVGNGIVFRSGRPTEEPRPRVWFTDGSTSGTRLLRDGVELGPGAVGETARLPDGRSLIARFPDSGLGTEPWLTDGTVSGTVPLDDLCAGSCSSSISQVTRAGGRRFFIGSVSSGDRRLVTLSPELELEVFDVATPQAAVPLYSPALAETIGHGEIPNLQLLVAVDLGPSQRALQLVSLDGTAQTVLDGVTSVGSLHPFRNGALTYVSRSGSSTFELVFVGEAGVSVLLESEGPFGVRALHPAFGDDQGYPLAFLSRRSGFGQPCQVWRTDGTAAGTWSLGEFPDGVCVDDLAIVDGRVVLSGQSSQTFRVASTDGTVPGFTTLHARDVGYGDRELAVLGGHLYWLDEHPAALMRTDGLQPSTTVCTFEQVDNDHGDRLHLARVGDGLLFTAQAADGSGTELRRWDGSTCGSEPIANLVPDARSTRVEGTLAMGSRLFVQEQTNTTIIGADQEVLEVDVASGTSFVVAEDRALLTRVGERLILQNGDAGFFSGARIYGLDTQTGTEALLLQTYPHVPGGVENGVFLAEVSAVTGYGRRFDALWFSDGTLEGTRLVRTFGDVGGIPGFFPWGRHGVVVALGRDVWRSDGTEAGTVPLIDPGSNLRVHGVADGAVFLTVDDGDEAPALLVLDVASGARRFDAEERLVTSAGTGLGAFRIFRNRLLFFGELPVDGPEGGGSGLWLTDGSILGTQLLGRLEPVRNFEWWPIAVNRGLAFVTAAGTEAGAELFVTNGTPEGTLMLGDAIPGIEGSSPAALTPVDGVLALERTTLEAGRELWLTDGTVDGTRMVEVEPGPVGSVPGHATPVADKVVFAADRSDVGRELFMLERRDLRSPCVPSPTAACVGDGRFQIEADWLDRASETRGRARAVPFTDDTARFWFFDEDNIELVVKVLDGRVVNDDWWVFYGATSDVDYWVTVTDTWSGESKSYTNRRGNQCGVNDTSAFDRRPEIDELTESPGAVSGTSLGTTLEGDVLSLHGGRFEARVRYHVGDEPGLGRAIPDTEQSGYFWFFDEANVELIVKVLDGRSVNGHWWVYHGGLSDLRYELELEDTETGAVWRDENPARSICGGSDVEAFE